MEIEMTINDKNALDEAAVAAYKKFADESEACPAGCFKDCIMPGIKELTMFTHDISQIEYDCNVKCGMYCRFDALDSFIDDAHSNSCLLASEPCYSGVRDTFVAKIANCPVDCPTQCWNDQAYHSSGLWNFYDNAMECEYLC